MWEVQGRCAVSDLGYFVTSAQFFPSCIEWAGGCARASALLATALLESRICLHKKPHFSVQPLCMNLHAFCEASGKSRHLNWGWGVCGGIADFQVWKGWDESFLCSAVLPRHQLLFGYGRHIVFKRKKKYFYRIVWGAGCRLLRGRGRAVLPRI